MLTQSDLDRERYEARRKAQMDQNTLLRVARMEGFEEGLEKSREERLEKGRLIGTIQICERVLRRPESPTEQLSALSPEDLKGR
jgi:hypothetical protein